MVVPSGQTTAKLPVVSAVDAAEIKSVPLYAKTMFLTSTSAPNPVKAPLSVNGVVMDVAAGKATVW